MVKKFTSSPRKKGGENVLILLLKTRLLVVTIEVNLSLCFEVAGKYADCWKAGKWNIIKSIKDFFMIACKF